MANVPANASHEKDQHKRSEYESYLWLHLKADLLIIDIDSYHGMQMHNDWK